MYVCGYRCEWRLIEDTVRQRVCGRPFSYYGWQLLKEDARSLRTASLILAARLLLSVLCLLMGYDGVRDSLDERRV